MWRGLDPVVPEAPRASIYQAQSNPVIDVLMKKGRLRFGNAEIFPRSDSVKPLFRAIKQEGRGFFNLPDMDFGMQMPPSCPSSAYRPPRCWPPRMARALNMVVQPVIAETLPKGQGWRIRFLPAMAHFPTADAPADTARLNQLIEREILKQPAQYLWVHKASRPARRRAQPVLTQRPPAERGLWRGRPIMAA